MIFVKFKLWCFKYTINLEEKTYFIRRKILDTMNKALFKN
jgi:hypothetical protein